MIRVDREATATTLRTEVSHSVSSIVSNGGVKYLHVAQPLAESRSVQQELDMWMVTVVAQPSLLADWYLFGRLLCVTAKFQDEFWYNVVCDVRSSYDVYDSCDSYSSHTTAREVGELIGALAHLRFANFEILRMFTIRENRRVRYIRFVFYPLTEESASRTVSFAHCLKFDRASRCLRFVRFE